MYEAGDTVGYYRPTAAREPSGYTRGNWIPRCTSTLSQRTTHFVDALLDGKGIGLCPHSSTDSGGVHRRTPSGMVRNDLRTVGNDLRSYPRQRRTTTTHMCEPYEPERTSGYAVSRETLLQY